MEEGSVPLLAPRLGMSPNPIWLGDRWQPLHNEACVTQPSLLEQSGLLLRSS